MTLWERVAWVVVGGLGGAALAVGIERGGSTRVVRGDAIDFVSADGKTRSTMRAEGDTTTVRWTSKNATTQLTLGPGESTLELASAFGASIILRAAGSRSELRVGRDGLVISSDGDGASLAFGSYGRANVRIDVRDDEAALTLADGDAHASLRVDERTAELALDAPGYGASLSARAFGVTGKGSARLDLRRDTIAASRATLLADDFGVGLQLDEGERALAFEFDREATLPRLTSTVHGVVRELCREDAR